MEQEQPVGGVKFPFIVMGRILLAFGILLAVTHLLPFVTAYSKKISSKKIIEQSLAEKDKLETPLAVASRRIIVLSSENGSGNSRGGLERAKQEAEYNRMMSKYNVLDKAENDAEAALARSQQVMDSKIFFAGISVTLMAAAVLFMVFAKDTEI